MSSELFLWWLFTYFLSRYVFTIKNGVDQCEYTKEFGFGGAYSIIIPSPWNNVRSCLYLEEQQYLHLSLWVLTNILLVYFIQCEDIFEVEEIQPNSVHMALQIPQYFLMTAGEVVFSVTGLEFSYSQVGPKDITVIYVHCCVPWSLHCNNFPCILKWSFKGLFWNYILNDNMYHMHV